MIEQIGKNESFDETAKIFELLQDLNPDLLNKGLKISSERVKRIFLYFVDYFNMPWSNEIKRDIVKNYKSVIVIEKGGKFVKEYNLIIPKNYEL